MQGTVSSVLFHKLPNNELIIMQLHWNKISGQDSLGLLHYSNKTKDQALVRKRGLGENEQRQY